MSSMDAADSSVATKDDVSSFRRPEEYNGDKDDQASRTRGHYEVH